MRRSGCVLRCSKWLGNKKTGVVDRRELHTAMSDKFFISGEEGCRKGSFSLVLLAISKE